jgi:hypothetical protein
MKNSKQGLRSSVGSWNLDKKEIRVMLMVPIYKRKRTLRSKTTGSVWIIDSFYMLIHYYNKLVLFTFMPIILLMYLDPFRPNNADIDDDRVT